jgi:alpha-L-rhamnosidase
MTKTTAFTSTLRIVTLVVISLCSVHTAAGAVRLETVELRCEYRRDPLGIDTTKPRLSWIIHSKQRGQRQTAYQVLVASSPELLARDQGNLWDSGRVKSDQSVLVEYAGAPLAAGTYCYWKVRIWDKDDIVAAWSEPARFTVGLLSAGDWKGRWIGMASADDHEEPWFRKTFTLEQKPQAALAYIGSVGHHELYVNGRKVGDRVLNPSVSYLAKRALYVTYDITDYLKPGANVVAVWLAPGWSLFKGVNPVMDFGLSKRPLLIAQLDIRAKQRDAIVVASDDTWRCRLSSEKHLGEWTYMNYGGDRIDATKDLPGWNDVGLDDSSWEQAAAYDLHRILSPDLVEPTRKCETIRPVSVTKIGQHKYRVDMGRFYAGWVEAKLKGKPGSTIVVSASYKPGEQCQCNQRNEYVIGAGGQGTFCNHFSYHGCRYVTIDGVDEPPAPTDVTGYRIGNDLRRVGHFDCSNKLLKRIYDADVNTCINLITGGMPVDCPHRERLGYADSCLGSLETAIFSFESGAWAAKWARDFCDIQQDDGYVANSAPTVDGGGAPWVTRAVMIVPWALFQWYGDRRTLEASYPYVKRWLAFQQTKCDANGLLAPFVPPGTTYPQWCFIGDWVTPHGSELSDSVEALFFNNCCYLMAVRTASQIALALKNPDDARSYDARAQNVKNSLNKRFFNASNNTYLDTRQTHCVMPLAAGAVSEDRVAAVRANLRNETLVSQKGHLDVGNSGHYYLARYLSEHDANDLVFTYVNQTTYPGYGFFIERGFDTWPETWTGDGDSMIHSCFTGISVWFLRGIAGIRPDPAAPGFKHFLIRPSIVGDITWATGAYECPYGRIGCQWAVEGGRLTVNTEIPANTTATIYLPTQNVSAVTESDKPANAASHVKFLRMEGGCAVYEVNSGNYQFTTPTSKP